MNDNIQITVVSGKFTIRCPFWGNDLVRALPSRKWDKAKRAWVAPIIRTNVEAIKRLAGTDGVQVDAKAKEVIDGYEAKLASGVRNAGFPAWYKFKREPRRHQKDALTRGYGQKAFALLMDMQTGKSKTSIDMVTAHRMEGHIRAVLILTKKTLRLNWANALRDDCPIEYSCLLPESTPSGKREFEQWLGTNHDFKIMVVGWESLSAGGATQMCERFLMAHHPTAIIGDEMNYIQEHKSTRTKNAWKLARMAEYRYGLTGTSAAEGLMKMYAQFEFLDPDIIGIGDFYAFRNRYAIMGGFVPKDGPMKGKPTQVVGYDNVDELMELIAPYSFQITKDDTYDLPPKRYQVRAVELTPTQRDAYTKIKRDKAVMVGGEERAVSNTLEVMLRLHQICGGHIARGTETVRQTADGDLKVKIVYETAPLVEPEDNPKLIELMNVVEEHRGKQGLCWAVYTDEIVDIVDAMTRAGLRVGQLHGGIPESERQPMVDAFNRGEYDWVVGNANTGGMGYSMHVAELNVFYSNTFKMRDRLQAEDRNWGDGQTVSPIIIDIIAVGTVDKTVYDALKQKEDVHVYVRRRIQQQTALLDGTA